MAGWVLGVDFGTSNTAAAHTGVRTGAIETLPLSHSGNAMPSAVFVESPHSILVGDVAINRAEMNPAAFIPSPKRIVGHGPIHVNGYDIAPSIPVAAVLQAVLTRAVAVHGGQLPDRLVLTHPEAWSQNEIGVLREAAERTGVDGSRLSLIAEPRAAAHYYTRAQPLDPGSRIAVFDFGGGTLDIAVLEADAQGFFSIVSARGDNGLGGKNFDALIRRWVDAQLEARDPELLDFIRRGATTTVLRTLADSIRRAKELLSESPSAGITVVGNGRQETLLLTRGEFESLIGAEVDRAVNLTRSALGGAGEGALRALYLTGGSSRIPLVHDRLRLLGPIATLDDPKMVVVQGALMAMGVQSAPPPQVPQQPHGGGVIIAPPVELSRGSAQMTPPGSWGAVPAHTAALNPAAGTPASKAPRVVATSVAALIVAVTTAVSLYTYFERRDGPADPTVMKAIPAALSQYATCEADYRPEAVECLIDPDSALASGLLDPGEKLSFRAELDPTWVAREFEMRRDRPDMYAQRDLEGSDASRIVNFPSDGFVQYFDAETGLRVAMDFESNSDAELFVSRLKLLG